MNKLIIVGCSTGGYWAVRRFLNFLELGNNYLFVLPHIFQPIIYNEVSKHYITHAIGNNSVVPTDAEISKILDNDPRDLIIPGESIKLVPGHAYVAMNTMLTKKYNIPFFGHYEFRDGNIQHFWSNTQQNELIDRSVILATEEFGEDCLGILLSGFGSDGTQAIERLNNIGITMAQIYEPGEKKTFRYKEEMPRSAVDAGAVRYFGGIEYIAETLNPLIHNFK